MITRIGVIYQDTYSLGFLKGLQRRLKCEAEIVGPPAGIGRTKLLTKHQAEKAYIYFQSKAVDLIVRFTDADRERWQDVRRKESEAFPSEAQSRLVCGVAVNNPEEWLCESPNYLAQVLDASPESITSASDRSSRIKNAVGRKSQMSESASSVIERIVAQAPLEVFKQWLRIESFRAFYQECRAKAKQFDCETPNEL